jgi:XRE family transcriptional regulator, aerobic/anaerobic benzoate catabolism transcriptional regulator
MIKKRHQEGIFLAQLGQHVRTMRSTRRMSRQLLARLSGISERYIAQLESGKGNVSIVLLHRLSKAMGASLEDMIPASKLLPDCSKMREPGREGMPIQIVQASGRGSMRTSARRRIDS